MKKKQLNSNNSSGITGVYYHKTKKKYQSKIGYNGRSIHIGYYDTIEEAAEARREAEDLYYGKWADIRFNRVTESDEVIKEPEEEVNIEEEDNNA